MNNEISIEELIWLSKSHPIVPFLGAGISIASGFPSIRQINHYLAKVDFAIQNGIFQHRYASGVDNAAIYKHHPSKFLTDFGWPEIGQLNADLWQWLTEPGEDPKKQESRINIQAIRDQFESDPDSLNHSKRLQDVLPYDLTKVTPSNGSNKPVDLALEQRDMLTAIVQYHLRADLARLESGADDAALRQWKRWKAWYRGEIPVNRGNQDLPLKQNVPELLVGNWESLLDHLCEGSLDLVDQLFTQLEIGRSPSLAHRYLAFLKQKLFCPMMLTTNFDSFLEQSLRCEGIDYEVFDVHRDAQLPDPYLVKRQFSVLKLHGSSYGLRLGERLKYPLDADSQQHIRRILPHNAILLVVGFSGYERRMLQLLRTIAEGHQKSEPPRIVWLTLNELEGWPRRLVDDHRDAIKQRKIEDAGTFLQHFYFLLGNSYPAAQTPYTALSEKIASKILVPDPDLRSRTKHPRLENIEKTRHLTDKERQGLNRRYQLQHERRKPVHIFVPTRLYSKTSSKEPTECSSLSAAAFVKDLGFEYRPIWISLEGHHTVAGLATEFFRKVAVYDPHAPNPPLNLTDVSNAAKNDLGMRKVIARILDVFQRGKFVLVLDLVESFGRPQTMHHGIPTYDVFDTGDEDGQARFDRLVSEFEERVSGLQTFLRMLVESADLKQCDRSAGTCAGYGESYLCITVGGEPIPRFRREFKILADKENLRPTQRSVMAVVNLVKDELPQLRDYVALHRSNSYSGKGPTYDAQSIGETNSHWLLNERLKPVERSKKRLQDIHCLIDFFAGAESSMKADFDGAQRSMVGLLSMLRRSRPIPVVHSIAERWISGIAGLERQCTSREFDDRLHKLVDHLTKTDKRGVFGERIAEFHEGGSLWLYRELRDQVYESLTENLSITAWVKAWRKSKSKPSGSNAQIAVTDSLISATWHWAAARTYYADVFRPTLDINAFYEYLYHRVSALRVITLALVICKNLPQELDFGALIKTGDSIGVFGPLGSRHSGAEFVDRLHELRAEGLTTLHRALERNRDVFRRNATPSTIRSWAKQFLEREFLDLSGVVFSAEVGLLGEGIDCSSADSLFETMRKELSRADVGGPEWRSSVAIAELVDFFHRIWRDAERADLSVDNAFQLALENVRRYAQFRESSSAPIQFRNMYFAASHDAHLCSIEHNRVFDASELDLDSEIKLLESTLRDSGHYRKFLELSAKSKQSGFQFWQTLFTQRALRVSENRASSSEVGCELDDDKVNSLKEAELEAIEYEKVLRSTATASDEDRRHRASALSLRARSLYLRNVFKDAHRWLDLAAAGLSGATSEQKVSLGFVHICRSELLILSADWHRFCNCRSGQYQNAMRNETPEEFLARQHQKILRARDELRLAAEFCKDSPHFPTWRINISIGSAICVLERLIIELDYHPNRMHGLDEFARQNGELEQLVLSAMKSIRSALDVLPITVTPDQNMCSASYEKFCYRIWQQLYVVFLISAARLRAARDGGKINTVSVLSRASAWADHDIERWKYFATSMRFNQISGLAKGFNIPAQVFQSVENEKDSSLSKAAIVLCLEQSSDLIVDEAWDVRRRTSLQEAKQKLNNT